MSKILLVTLTFTTIIVVQAECVPVCAQPIAKQDSGVAELVRIRSRDITFFDLSPDGRSLAYADVTYADGRPLSTAIVVIDVKTGKELSRGLVSERIVHDGLFSADGQLLALGSLGKNAYVWDVRKGEKQVDLALPESTTQFVPERSRGGMPLAFSPDGKFIAGNAVAMRESVLVLWETATGNCRPILCGDPEKSPLKVGAREATFADDGGPFLFAQLGGMCVCSISDAKLLGDRIHVGLGWSSPDRMQIRGPGLRNYPGSATRKYRFRTTPGGPLPKYDEPPIAFVPDHDGTMALVAIDPAEWTIGNPHPSTREKELCRLRDFENTTDRRGILSADGKILVAMGIDPATLKDKNPTSMLVIWDVSKLHEKGMVKRKQPSPADLVKYWQDLSSKHLPHAHKAMLIMQRSSEQAVPFLGKKLGPPADLPRIAKLIKELEHPKFPVRDQATRELQLLGHAAQSSLEKASKEKISEEGRERIGQLLNKLQPTVANDELRYLRVIDVLEHINTPPARELLQTIASGGYGPGYAGAAKAALQRGADKR